MLVFGQWVGAEYAKYISGSVVPIGSFKNNNIPIIQTYFCMFCTYPYQTLLNLNVMM